MCIYTYYVGLGVSALRVCSTISLLSACVHHALYGSPGKNTHIHIVQVYTLSTIYMPPMFTAYTYLHLSLNNYFYALGILLPIVLCFHV